MKLDNNPFLGDLGGSLAVWRKAPLLPVVTGILAAGSLSTAHAHGNFAVLIAGLVIGFFSFGWLGTQFIWYQHAFEGQPVRAGELLSLTWRFIARYVRFYVLGLIPVFVLLVFVVVRWRTFAFESLGWRVGLLAYLLAFDIAGTFVNPTLAFSTRRVFKAIPAGLRILAGGWPENWKYAVVPGVSAAALGGLNWIVPSPAQPALVILIALIDLLFTGAIARYYLRGATTHGSSGLDTADPRVLPTGGS